MSSYDYIFKVLLLGDSGVGKTSIMRRYLDDQFRSNHVATIGVDFRLTTIDVDGRKVKLQIWDTAGQERFRSVTSSYYYGADGAIIVYDVSNAESFRNVDSWLNELRRHSNSERMSVVAIGNKCDKIQDKAVSYLESLAHLGKVEDLTVVEVSAKTDLNVDQIFSILVEKMMTNIHKEDDRQSVVLEQQSKSLKKKTVSCCR